LGVVESAAYNTKTTQLIPGDALFLYTDGITEAREVNCLEFGEERLISSLQQPKKKR